MFSTTGPKLQDVKFSESNTTLLCDISTGSPRPVVPRNWKWVMFDTIHSLSHPGTKASQRLVAAKFVWQGLKKDVRDWANTCVKCQRTKIHRHIKAPLRQFEVPEQRFDHVNIDLVGPLPPSKGYIHLLTWVSMGHAGHQNGAKGRPSVLPRRASLWPTTAGARGFRPQHHGPLVSCTPAFCPIG